MKNFIFILIAIFALNTVSPASTFETKTLTEQSDKKPSNKKSKKHKKSKKTKRHAKKKGLITKGCRGAKAHPNHKSNRR